MAIKRLQADLPGPARHVEPATSATSPRAKPEKKPPRAQERRRPGATTTAASPRGSAAAATSSATASSTSSARRPACRPPCSRSSTTRTALPGSRSSTTPTARARTSLRLTAAVGDTVIAASTADIKPGNSLPLRYIPLGTDDPQRRAAKVGSGGQIGPVGRRRGQQLMAKDGDWAHAPHALGRGAARPHRLPRHDRPGRQLRPRERPSRARPAARAGSGIRPHNRGVTMNPVDHPMGGGEGRYLRRPPPVLAVGQADQGRQDAPQQAHGRRSSSGAGTRSRSMARSIKKGPFVDGHLHEEDRGRPGQRDPASGSIKTWSRRSTIMPRHGRAQRSRSTTAASSSPSS